MPRDPPATDVRITTSSGEVIEGELARIDEFVVSVTLPDGVHRSFMRTDRNIPRVEIRDPLEGHKRLLRIYSDSDIHNVTAYLVTVK